jgi:hypothetical protein
MARTYPWKVSDELWEHVEPLIPPALSHAKGGRPRMSDRQAFTAIVYGVICEIRSYHEVQSSLLALPQ